MPAVYQDLVDLHLPEWKIGEIVNGRLVVRRLPKPIGTNAHSALLFLLRDVGLHGAWTFAGDGVVRSRPFDTLDIELRHLWP